MYISDGRGLFLLGEDEVDCESAARILRAAGFEVTAAGGLEGVRAIGELVKDGPVQIEVRRDGDKLLLTVAGATFSLAIRK
jgi:hypothetical protein